MGECFFLLMLYGIGNWDGNGGGIVTFFFFSIFGVCTYDDGWKEAKRGFEGNFGFRFCSALDEVCVSLLCG